MLQYVNLLGEWSQVGGAFSSDHQYVNLLGSGARWVGPPPQIMALITSLPLSWCK